MTAAFLTRLSVEKAGRQPDRLFGLWRGRPIWRLTAPLVYRSAVLGCTIEVPAGASTDFASVPRLPLAWLVAGDTAHGPAVVHDWLYQEHQACGRPVSRSEADAVFREAMAVEQPELGHDANGAGTRGLMWTAVRVGGLSAWRGAEARQEQLEVACRRCGSAERS